MSSLFEVQTKLPCSQLKNNLSKVSGFFLLIFLVIESEVVQGYKLTHITLDKYGRPRDITIGKGMLNK